MKLLLTGCFDYSNKQIELLKSIGFDVYYIKNESDKIPFDTKSFDAVVCNGLFLYHDIKDFRNLKIIQLTSAGLDRVPLDYIKNKSIQIHNARGVYSIPMAEWALTKVLDVYKNTEFFHNNQKGKKWIKERNLREIDGKKVAVIGAGNVGEEVAKRFGALNASVDGFDISPMVKPFFLQVFGMDTLADKICEYDIIIVTLPLTAETKGMFDHKLLSKMKGSSMIINVSRGAVFNEKDLTNLLIDRTDIIAALDVFESEPLNVNSKLWNLPNAILSPHNSFVSEGNNYRMFSVIFNNLKHFISIQ